MRGKGLSLLFPQKSRILVELLRVSGKDRFEPSDGLTDRISYLHISVGLILSPARLTRLRYPRNCLVLRKKGNLFLNITNLSDFHFV